MSATIFELFGREHAGKLSLSPDGEVFLGHRTLATALALQPGLLAPFLPSRVKMTKNEWAQAHREGKGIEWPENTFDLAAHSKRQGTHASQITDKQKAEWERKHKCKVIFMRREIDGAEVNVNAGDVEGMQTWQLQGFHSMDADLQIARAAFEPHIAVASLETENAELKQKVAVLSAAAVHLEHLSDNAGEYLGIADRNKVPAPASTARTSSTAQAPATAAPASAAIVSPPRTSSAASRINSKAN